MRAFAINFDLVLLFWGYACQISSIPCTEGLKELNKTFKISNFIFRICKFRHDSCRMILMLNYYSHIFINWYLRFALGLDFFFGDINFEKKNALLNIGQTFSQLSLNQNVNIQLFGNNLCYFLVKKFLTLDSDVPFDRLVP